MKKSNGALLSILMANIVNKRIAAIKETKEKVTAPKPRAVKTTVTARTTNKGNN